MLLYVIAGKTRQGKSRLAKSMVTGPKSKFAPCLVYDPQREYGNKYLTDINDVPTWVAGPGLPEYRPGLKRSRYTGSWEDFVKIVGEHKDGVRVLRGYNILIEEGTVNMKGRIPPEFIKLCVDKFHDQNNIIVVFHSLDTVPPDFMRLVDYVVIFRTNDNYATIKSRFNDHLITEGYRRQRLKPSGSPPTTVNRKKDLIDGREFDPPDDTMTTKNVRKKT